MATPKRAPASRRRPAAGSGAVRVRMYRQGLGDCFLLSFPTEDGGRFHLLIDCGVLLGTPNAAPRMIAVARDIAVETGGSPDGRTKGRIDVLVATHEHWDHVSGFEQASEVFKEQVEVGEVWLAWTEDPAHPLANELRQDRERKVAHLHAAAERLRGDAALAGMTEAIGGVLEFFGGLNATGQASSRTAIESLARRPDARVAYRRPGEPPVRLGGVPGVRVYVLGPPEDRKLIKKSDPTKRGREVYDQHASLSLADSFFAGLTMRMDVDGRAALGRAEMDPEVAELAWPFDRQYRIPLEEGESRRVIGADSTQISFFEEFYGFDDEGASAWRRIDRDWLGVAGDLALALDSDTNNTSLALAFELGERGPVLLFPGDAQVGNWLSWEALSWPVDPARPEGAKVTSDDLLGRTVLYKVGHHGSHNATLREKGLEKMTSPELVALVPVDKEMAKHKKWDMPFGPLYERLLARTRGRIVLADDGRLPVEEASRHGLTRREWDEFERRTPADPGQDALWIDCWIDT